MKYFLLFTLLLTTFYLLLTFPAEAARLYFEPSAGNFSPDAPIPVDLKIDTENQSINGIEGYLNFSSDIFSIEKISDGNSIINFWVMPAKTEDKTMQFAGVIPGGYQGTNGLLLKMFLQPKKEGRGEINISQNTQILLNNGQGTQANFKTTKAVLNVKKNGQISTILKDTEPPEAFIPQISQESDIFNNQWFLVFGTQDKNSGLDYYEIKEMRHFKFWEWGFWAKQPKINWQKAESPYLLKDQDLKSDIFVKATDKAGNEMTVMLPIRLKPWYQEPLVDIVAGAGVGIVVLLFIWLWKKYIRKRK